MNQEEPLSRWVVLLVGFFFGVLAGLIAASNLGAAEPTVIFEDSFERPLVRGNWAAPWELRGQCGSHYTWGPTSCRSSDGQQSAWCALTQSDYGNTAFLPCAQPYPPGFICATLQYGPFPAQESWVEFDWWLRSSDDYLYICWSDDGHARRDLQYFTGDMGDEWHSSRYDIPPADSAHIEIGFAAGKYLNGPQAVPNGAFVDNVRIYSVGDDQDPVDDPPDDPVDDPVDDDSAVDSLRAVIEEMREVICNE
jgi:hypothetical protein